MKPKSCNNFKELLQNLAFNADQGEDYFTMSEPMIHENYPADWIKILESKHFIKNIELASIDGVYRINLIKADKKAKL